MQIQIATLVIRVTRPTCHENYLKTAAFASCEVPFVADLSCRYDPIKRPREVAFYKKP